MPSRAIVPFAILGGVSLFYSASIALVLLTPALEKHAVYMHRLTLTKGKDVKKPEQFGFAHCQTSSFHIKTEDGARIHAWHVLPIGLYRKHAANLIRHGRRHQRFTDTINFQLLRDDPEARLVIHTHGTSGALAAYCRPDSYRALSSTAPDHIHVFAFDYRGFGLSSGTPTEEGLQADVRAVFRWANEVARVPPERIVIFGQSLGSGVAISLVRELALQKISVAGLILTGSFPDVPTMIAEYRTVFGLRILGPIAKFPGVMALLTRRMRNQWSNKDRLMDVVKQSSKYHIEIFHAMDDPIVPWYLSDVLFEYAVKAAVGPHLDRDTFSKEKMVKRVDMGEGGWYIDWPTARGLIRQEVTRYGLHDRIMSHPQIAIGVIRAFQSTDPGFLS